MVDSLDARSDVFVERVSDTIREAAADGAILVEVRFGSATSFRSDFMPLFREAELRVQRDFPRCQAEAIISGLTPSRPDRWEPCPDPKLECAAVAGDLGEEVDDRGVEHVGG
jgi:hypothetical protein